MFDSDLPFPQAIPALADCYEAAAPGTFRMSFVLAGAMVIAVPSLFYLGRPARSPIAAAQFFFLPARSVDCRATIFLLAGAICRLPGRNFSLGRRNPRLLRRNFFFRPERSVDCRAAIFLLAGAIRRLPGRNFSFGRSNLLIAAPQFFFWPARSPIAAPQFFFWPARSVDCRAAIFLLAGAIR